MNKETEVLYKIFELELSPPFTVDYIDISLPDIYNRFSENIGYYREVDSCLMFYRLKEFPIFKKIKKTFNVNEVSDIELNYITKHLANWFQGKLPLAFEYIEYFNYDTRRSIRYFHPKNIENS